MKNLFISISFLSLALFLGSCSGKIDTPDFETVPVRRNNISASILATGIIKSKIGAEVRVGIQSLGDC